MANHPQSRFQEILSKSEADILQDWVKEQLAAPTLRLDLLPEANLRRDSAEFLGLFVKAGIGGNQTDITDPAWNAVRDCLSGIARARVFKGFSPSETATFVFSLKQPILARMLAAADAGAAGAADDLWVVTALLDKLGLFTAEVFMKTREEVIKRQQLEMIELSIPVVQIWDGILTLPLIGTLDRARAQVVMESLLQSIVDTASQIAIIDITGVPAVDTLVAQHLLKTVGAARLMGAQCVISGIRPQIAQTMIHLGVVFGDVVTKATLADALQFSFRQLGLSVTRKPTAG